MGNVLLALEALNALVTLTANSAAAAQEISSVIGQAQAAGQDIADAQLQAIIARRQAADAALAKLLNVPVP